MNAKFYYKSSNAPTPNRPNHIGTTAIIINDKSEILLERRSDSNRWGLIGGGLKIDESLKDGCCREVFEEIGIVASTPTQYKIYDDPTRIVAYPDGNVLRIITVAFLIYVDNDVKIVTSEESNELKFFTSTEILDLDIVETHRHILEDFIFDKKMHLC